MADHDVLVVGGGPSGAACAYWLAEAGHDVVVVEKKHFPRVKTCGDGLTPRAVKQLDDMGLADGLAVGAHRFDGLRSIAFGKTIELQWPERPGFPRHGYVITRHDLDQMVAERAEKAGATVLQGMEAIEPHLDGGVPRGAVVKNKDTGDTTTIRATYTVVADGANSRFGRALGCSRDRAYPLGMAIRGYFTSPRSHEPWIESHLDVRDARGNVLPGYGWIFPLGDGRVNVGVGLLSTFKQWKEVNTSKLMDAFVDYAPASWEISPETSLGPPTGRQAAHGPVGGAVVRARRGSPPATPPAPSTRSTARASPTPTRPGATRPRPSTRPSTPARRPPCAPTRTGCGPSTTSTTGWPGRS